MKKLAKVLFYFALTILVLCSIYSSIYEYLIWDKSTVSDFSFNLILIIGVGCLFYIGIYYYLSKHKF